MELPLGDPTRRPVRSYHQRAGRLNPTQERGVADGWPRFGVDLPATTLDLTGMFGPRPVVLDIGFGMGETLLASAAQHRDWGILGVEVNPRGLGQVLADVLDRGYDHVRVMRVDANELLRDHLEPGSVREVHLYFADPWPKSRHHKRRLVQPEWAKAVARVLEPGGIFHSATDWADYARHMAEVLDAEPALTRRDDLVGEYRDARPTTKYERRGLAQGHQVTDLVYQRAPH